MTNLDNYLNQTGKILYGIFTFPYKVLIGYYNPEYQQKLKKNKELKEKIKSLDSGLEQTKLERENLASQLLNRINLNRKIMENHKNN